MITLLAFSQEQPAQLLVNYLRTQSIDAVYQKMQGELEHVVLIRDQADITKAKQIASEFVAKPTDKKYQQAAWTQGKVVELQSQTGLFSGVKPLNLKTTPFTAVVLVICLVVFGISWLGGFNFVLEWFQIRSLNELSSSHQWWRLLGPAFIHFSEIHLIFNLLWWWSLGGKIEQKFGTSTLALIFFVAAVSSNIGQLVMSGTNFGGLSGVVYAVVGFVWWIGWLKPNWGLALPKPVIGFLLVWLLLGYADVLWVSMANTAHTVGLVVGCSAAWLVCKLAPQTSDTTNHPDKGTW